MARLVELQREAELELVADPSLTAIQRARVDRGAPFVIQLKLRT